jgi:hypothetical protein
MGRSNLLLTAACQRPLQGPLPEAGLQQWLRPAPARWPPPGGQNAPEQDRFIDLPARPINTRKAVQIGVLLGYRSLCLIIKKEHQ